jgi:hypothetical protein
MSANADEALDRFRLFGSPNGAHASFADRFYECVFAVDHDARAFILVVEVGSGSWSDASDRSGRLKKTAGVGVRFQQGIDLLTQRGIAGASLDEVRLPCRRGFDFQGAVEDGLGVGCGFGHRAISLWLSPTMRNPGADHAIWPRNFFISSVTGPFHLLVEPSLCVGPVAVRRPN